jgi:predicted lactoylglutathione lyase
VATTQEALQVNTIVPNFTVDDLQKSITFYEALGFTVDERWEDNGALLGVMLRAGKNQLGLSQDDWRKGRNRQKGVGMRISMSTTQNVDEIAARAKSAGIKLDSEPHDTEWKSRAFEVTDPTGFLLTISSEVAA